MKKLFTFFALTVMVLVALVTPVSASAQIVGDGTVDKPYQIATAEDLCKAWKLTVPNQKVYFVQTADIDMEGVNEWHAFVGYDNVTYSSQIDYDGQNHLIKNFAPESGAFDTNLQNCYNTSIFGVLNGTVRNLGVVDVIVDGPQGCGIIAGYGGHSSGSAATIQNVFVTGSVKGTGYLGGLVGTTGNTTTIKNCYVNIELEGGANSAAILGRLRNDLILENVYAAGSVSKNAGALLVSSDNTDKTVKVTNVVAFNTGVDNAFNSVVESGEKAMMANTAADKDAGIEKVKSWDGYSKTDMVYGLPGLDGFGYTAEKIIETATATIIVQGPGEKYEEPRIEGAIVTFMGQDYITPENGTVVIKDINPDDVLGKPIPFTVHKDGYKFYEGTVNFTEGYEGYGEANLIPEIITLTIKVTDADYEPIEGAQVYFNDKTYVTDETGSAKIEGLNGPDVMFKEDLFYSVFKEGYVSFEGNALIETAPEAILHVQLVAEIVTLTIKVTDADYEPIAEAQVYFNDDTYVTDETGSVTIEGLNGPDVMFKEDLFYSVYKDGYETFEGNAFIETAPEAILHAELVAAEATLDIKVMAGDDPVEKAYITFDGKEYYTDENGYVMIKGLYAPDFFGKTFPVTVYKDGYVEFEGEADFSETIDAHVTVYLEPEAGTFTVKVFCDNEPVEGAMVTFLDEEYFTDETGEVKVIGLDAPALIGTTVAYTVYKDGYEPFEGEADFTETMDAWSIAELEAAEATLTIKVMADEDPVEGAVVTFNGEEYTTDANGEVKLTGLYAPDFMGKTFPVTVTKDGYETFEGEADFTEGMDAFVVVELVNIQTGIYAIFNDLENSDVKVYDLNGRRVIYPKNGQVYIVNGMKVLLNR